MAVVGRDKAEHRGRESGGEDFELTGLDELPELVEVVVMVDLEPFKVRTGKVIVESGGGEFAEDGREGKTRALVVQFVVGSVAGIGLVVVEEKSEVDHGRSGLN
jgi:hypothetical protein